MEADAVRTRLAAVPDPGGETPHRIGEVSLHEHQRAAVLRARETLRALGGVLLADAVGLGKTYTALAVARDYTKRVVVAPAVLHGQWRDAARATGVPIGFASTESLSRGFLPQRSDVVIVDEAHHFRTPGTARYAKLAELTATTPVILLTATPVHNSRRDLDALLALFLGSRSPGLSDQEVARCIVRREHRDVRTLRLPRLHRLRRIEIPASSRVVEAICSLPDPVPLSDGRGAGALVRAGLLQHWASSDAALLASIRRRLLCAAAVRETLRAGLIPSRRELATWLSEDAVQLGFSELLIQPEHSASIDALPAIDIHVAALKSLRSHLRSLPSRDDLRRAHLRAMRRAHAGTRIVAFSAYAQTVRSLFHALSGDGAVAMVSGQGGWIASGRMPAAEVLRMFRAPGHDRERIDLLLATDLLSEGLNLPEASVIVHLDLPWTAARMQQRVGRLRRPGSASHIITRYAFVQPASVERRMRKEMLLTRKAETAVAVLSGIGKDTERLSPALAAELSRQVTASWRTSRSSFENPPMAAAHILTAAVRANAPGFIAAVRTSSGDRLVSLIGADRPIRAGSFDPRRVYAALLDAGGVQVSVPVIAYRRARRAIEAALRAVALEDSLGGEPSGVVLDAQRRLRRAVVTAPPHQRPELAAKAATLTDRLCGRLTIGVEHRVARLIADTGDDKEFVARCAALLHEPPASSSTAGPPRVSALLLLVSP